MGRYYSEVLLKFGGYTENQVTSVGSLRKKKSEKTQINKGTISKKVILFASQPIPDRKFRDMILADVLTVAKKLEADYDLIIRPHPNEKDDHYFTSHASRIGLLNYKLERTFSLEDHFKKADILLTAYSTVGAEFVEYYKPILVLDYKQEDLVGYCLLYTSPSPRD